MSACRASLAALLLLCGCAARLPAPAEREPLDPRAAQREAVPDDLERAASRALALSFSGHADEAALVVGRMRDTEAERRAAGRPASGLPDWAEAAVAAAGSERARAAYAEHALEREDLDPVLRARFERMREQQPLAVARRALADEKRFRAASAFNRVTAPLTRFVLSGGLDPFESGRSALRSLLLVHHFPAASARERRALAAYDEYLARDPDGPEAAEVRAEIDRLRTRLARARAAAARDSARSALERGRAESALAFAARAERALPGDPETEALRASAEALRTEREQALRRALGAEGAEDAVDELRSGLAVSVLAEPTAGLPEGAAAARAAGAIRPAEQRFIDALALRGPGQDEVFLELLRETAELPGPNPMARHAARVLVDPEQNPYRAYRAALSAQRKQLTAWVLFGRLARGPAERDLPRPLEYLLDATSIPVILLALPLRLLGLPSARRAASPPILQAGERYLARFPEGVHAASLHRQLETRSASAGLYTRALEHNAARGGSPRRAQRYREALAAALLEAAPRERRPDMRVAVYAELLSKYGDTHSAPRARRELSELLERSSPQQIRLSREFLLEHPALTAADALGLRPELLDGEGDNGEIAEDGVTLAGQRWVRVALEDREPALQRVPAANLARLAALLDEASYRALASDPRAKPASDPQRDAFLERARLGLLDEPERRASARSEAEYLGEREMYGLVRTRDSILPFELVVTGDIESLGLGAAPQLRLPDPGADAFLYE
jgi:hypothetical protein